MKIEDLRDRLYELNEESLSLQAKADSEKRDLTEDESTKFDALTVEFKNVERDIERREKMEAQTQKLATVISRQSDPDVIQNTATKPAPAKTGLQNTRLLTTEERGRWGWYAMGDFAMAVRQASMPGASASSIDPRLIRNAPGSTTTSRESVGADGGFAVPTDFRTEIMAQVMADENLLPKTDQLTTSSNQLTVPTDATTPWGANGIQGYWLGEGDLKPQSKVALGETSIKLNKLAALVPVTDELLEDAPGLDSYLRKKVPEVFNYKIDLAIIAGTGVGQPLGILNSAGTVSVAKEGTQVADTIVYNNIIKMWSRMRPASRPRAIWLVNQAVETQLFTMVQTIKNVAGTENVGGSAVYTPMGGASGQPFSTLFGRPVFASESMSTLGDKGDIILADMSQYLTITKTGGLKTDVSIHLWFDYDTTAYRFVMRIAGQPWWTSVVTSRDSVTRSPFVTLDERA